MRFIRVEILDKFANADVLFEHAGEFLMIFVNLQDDAHDADRFVMVTVPSTTGDTRISPVAAARLSSSIRRSKSASARASSLCFIRRILSFVARANWSSMALRRAP